MRLEPPVLERCGAAGHKRLAPAHTLLERRLFALTTCELFRRSNRRVERLWGVLQDRLSSELRLTQAADIDSANTVLRQFIADYSRRFARPPREKETAWRPAPVQIYCCHEDSRRISDCCRSAAEDPATPSYLPSARPKVVADQG